MKVLFFLSMDRGKRAPFFPAVMLRADGDVFLDDMTPAKLSQKLGGIPVCACPSDGAEVLKALLGISDDQ